MGRTLPTSRLQLQTLHADWGFFTEVLSREDQETFARMWQAAERRASAIGNVARPNPMEGVLMAMVVELARDNHRMRERLDRLDCLDLPAR